MGLALFKVAHEQHSATTPIERLQTLVVAALGKCLE